MTSRDHLLGYPPVLKALRTEWDFLETWNPYPLGTPRRVVDEVNRMLVRPQQRPLDALLPLAGRTHCTPGDFRGMCARPDIAKARIAQAVQEYSEIGLQRLIDLHKAKPQDTSLGPLYEPKAQAGGYELIGLNYANQEAPRKT